MSITTNDTGESQREADEKQSDRGPAKHLHSAAFGVCIYFLAAQGRAFRACGRRSVIE